MTTIFDVPGTNPPNPFSTTIQTLLTSISLSTSKLDETAAQLVSTITTSSDPAHALWEFWDAFFTAVATSSSSHPTLLGLLKALQAQSPTQPNNVRAKSDAESYLRSYTQANGTLNWSELPRFAPQAIDTQGVLENWRDWDGVRDSNISTASATSSSNHSTPKNYYLNFCTFLATLLKETNGKGEIHPIHVFYACKNVLEHEGPQPRDPPRAHRMSPEQLWALDVRVTAIWVKSGGSALWETDREELRRHWTAALDEPTEMWPKEDGLTPERWQLWGKRLRTLSTQETDFDEETRAVLTEAAKVVEGLLAEHST